MPQSDRNIKMSQLKQVSSVVSLAVDDSSGSFIVWQVSVLLVLTLVLFGLAS